MPTLNDLETGPSRSSKTHIVPENSPRYIAATVYRRSDGAIYEIWINGSADPIQLVSPQLANLQPKTGLKAYIKL
jgi:hypothetical protein